MQLAANQPPAAGQPLAAGQPPAAAPTSAVNRRGRGSLRDVVVSLLARAAQLLGSGVRAARYPATQQAMRSLQDALEVEFATPRRGTKKPGSGRSNYKVKEKGLTGHVVTKTHIGNVRTAWSKGAPISKRDWTASSSQRASRAASRRSGSRGSFARAHMQARGRFRRR